MYPSYYAKNTATYELSEEQEARVKYLSDNAIPDILEEASIKQLKDFAIEMLGHGGGYTHAMKRAFENSTDVQLEKGWNGFVKFVIRADYYESPQSKESVIIVLYGNGFKIHKKNNKSDWNVGKLTAYPGAQWYEWDILIPKD